MKKIRFCACFFQVCVYPSFLPSLSLTFFPLQWYTYLFSPPWHPNTLSHFTLHIQMFLYASMWHLLFFKCSCFSPLCFLLQHAVMDYCDRRYPPLGNTFISMYDGGPADLALSVLRKRNHSWSSAYLHHERFQLKLEIEETRLHDEQQPSPPFVSSSKGRRRKSKKDKCNRIKEVQRSFMRRLHRVIYVQSHLGKRYCWLWKLLAH